MKKIIFTVGNITGFILILVINTLANLLPLNSKTTGELSGQYPNLFVPAGITFAIWAIIYICLAGFIIYNLYVLFNNTDDSNFINRINIFFLISCVSNCAWIFAWHYEKILFSFIIMLILLSTLIALYLSLNIGKSSTSRLEKYFIHIPVSIYLGWITIAAIANTVVLLIYLKWNRFGLSEQFWTMTAIMIGIILAVIIMFKRRDIYFPLVINWAFLGIIIKRLSDNNHIYYSIIITAGIGIIIITAFMITQAVRKKIY